MGERMCGGREGEMKGSVENRSFNGYNLPYLKGRIVHCLQKLKQFSVDIQTNLTVSLR